LDRSLVEMVRLGRDNSVLAVIPLMAQVWARKPPDGRKKIWTISIPVSSRTAIY
jgi:hypothetical protein